MSKENIKDYETEIKMLTQQLDAFKDQCHKAYERVNALERENQAKDIKIDRILKFVNNTAQNHADVIKLIVEGRL